jgi:adenine-specific DNA methylase
VDPREFRDKEDWDWAELNLFHSADTAKQILAEVDTAIAAAEYLRKKEKGEVEVDKFKNIWARIKGEGNGK